MAKRAPSSVPAGGNVRARNGFSLIELLVALFVLALLSGVAVLSMPDGGSDLRRSAERFAARAGAARDEAIVGARPVAVVVGPAGYYFERRVQTGWQPLDAGGSRLDGGDWPKGTSVLQGGSGEGANRRIVFDTLGLASNEARIALSRGDHASTVIIRRNGEIAMEGAR